MVTDLGAGAEPGHVALGRVPPRQLGKHSKCFAAMASTSQSRKQEKALAEPPLAEADKPALFSPSCSASPSSPGSGSEDQDEGKGALPPRRSPQQPAGAGSSSGRSPEDEEEDVLKYVREIFFS